MNIYDNKEDLLNFLNIKKNFINEDISKKYHIKIIKKKDGGDRIIKPPSTKLKLVQRKILDEIIKKVPMLACVYGLDKEHGIKQNALAHSKNHSNFVICLDISDFFGSIHYKTIKEVYKRIGFNEENTALLTKLSTSDGSLPQGSPLSSHLASLAVYAMDVEIIYYVDKKNLVYTRYVDDIAISGKNLNDSNVADIKKIIEKHRLKTNKKEVFYKKEDEKLITEIRLIRDNVTVSQKYEEELISMLPSVNPKNDKRFMGKLGFYLHINRKRAKRFYKEVLGIA